MTTHKILTILVVCLMLSQLALAKPAATHADHFDLCKIGYINTVFAPSDRDSQMAATLQLMKKIVFDMQDLALTYVKQAKNISDQLLKESVLDTNQSPEMQKFKQDIQDFEKEYSNCSKLEELFDLMDLFSNATSKYYEMETNGTLTADTKIILDVLKKYSTKEVDVDMEKKFISSVIVSFEEKLDGLREKLIAEEAEMGEKILQWWDKVKTLKTTEEKVESFIEYMKLHGY